MPLVKLVAEFLPAGNHEPDASDEFTYEIIFPSNVIREYFKTREKLAAVDFLAKAIVAMKRANANVLEKYGFSCLGCEHYEKELERMLLRADIRDKMVLVQRIDG